MERLLELHDRCVYHVPVPAGRPATYLLADREAGGILINTPPFAPELAAELAAITRINFLFYPSRFGACDVDAWRGATGARSLAYGEEADAVPGRVDIVLDRQSKLTRTIDFLPMSGRTRGSCALRARNLPGMIFFGPILTPGDSGWPTLIAEDDDYSYENRVFGVLGLQDLKYEYAFSDVFQSGHTRYGPGAGAGIQQALRQALAL